MSSTSMPKASHYSCLVEPQGGFSAVKIPFRKQCMPRESACRLTRGPRHMTGVMRPLAALGATRQDQIAMEFPLLQHKPLQAVPLGSDNLFTVPGLLTVQEAQACIDYAEALGFQHQGSRGPAYGEAFRDNDRVSVQDQGIADALWFSTGLSKLLAGRRVDGAAAVGCNPNIRFYRYNQGNRFGKHIDDSVELEGGQRTWLTMLVYLSGQPEGSQGNGGPPASDTATPPTNKRTKRATIADDKAAQPPAGQQPQQQQQQQQGAAGQQQGAAGQQQGAAGGLQGAAGQQQGAAARGQPHRRQQQNQQQHQQQQHQPAVVNPSAVQDLQGGETAFYNERGRLVASVQPRPGLALLHLHGEDRCMEHEALVVRQGTKYVLRTDVVFR